MTRQHPTDSGREQSKGDDEKTIQLTLSQVNAFRENDDFNIGDSSK